MSSRMSTVRHLLLLSSQWNPSQALVGKACIYRIKYGGNKQGHHEG